MVDFTEMPNQWVVTSVTRLGDLLHFGQLFKACGNNYYPNRPHFRQFWWRWCNLSFFCWNHLLGNFYRHLATFYWSHWTRYKLDSTVASLWMMQDLSGGDVLRGHSLILQQKRLNQQNWSGIFFAQIQSASDDVKLQRASLQHTNSKLCTML